MLSVVLAVLLIYYMVYIGSKATATNFETCMTYIYIIQANNSRDFMTYMYVIHAVTGLILPHMYLYT